MIKVISTDAAPKPVAAYSQAIETTGLLFTAGLVGLDPATSKLVDGLENQARRAFENLRAILAAAGLGVNALVKVTIYLTDLSQFAKVNEVFEQFVGAHRPTRTTVGVMALPMGALIEVDGIAAGV